MSLLHHRRSFTDRSRRRRHPLGARLALGAAAWTLRVFWWTPLVALAWRNRPYELDLLAQFAPHAAVLVGIVAACLATLRARRLAIEGGVVFAAISTLCLAAHYGGGPAAPGSDGDRASLRIVTYNAKWVGPQPEDRFIDWLREQDADLVCLFDPPWSLVQRDEWLAETYPHRITPRQGMWWSIVLLSRHPLRPAEMAEHSEETKFSFIALRSVIATPNEGVEVVFTGMRPRSPRTREDWRRSLESVERDAHIFRDYVEDQGLPIILAADMNSTPTGRLHRTFAAISGLLTWGSPFGRGTWPSQAAPLISLPIDRVWTTPDVRIKSVVIGPRFSSDHRPVVVDVEIPQQAQRAEGGAAPPSP